MVRWLRRITLSIVLIVMGLAAWAWHWASRVPTISRNFAAEYNQPILDADPSTLAWPMIRRAMLDRPDVPETLWRLDYVEKTGWADRAKPGDALWPEVAAYLDDLQPTLATIREAARRERLGYVLTDGDDQEMIEDGHRRSRQPIDITLQPATDNPTLFDVQFVYIGNFRFCARLLRVDTYRAAAAHDADRILENVEALFNLSRLAPQRASMFGHFVSVAIDSLTLNLIRENLETAPQCFDAGHLARLDDLVASRAAKQPLDAAFEFERRQFEDLLQRTFSDVGSGNGTITLQGIRTWRAFINEGETSESFSTWETLLHVALAIAYLGDRKEQLECYDSLIQSIRNDAQVNPWDYDGASPATTALLEPEGIAAHVRWLPTLVLAPATEKTSVARWQLLEAAAATRCVVAMHRYRLDHQHWPSALTDLVPRYLPDVPLDRFDGQPLRYRLDGAQPILYSIGANRIDDGGKPAPPNQLAFEWVAPSRLATDPRFKRGPRSAWDNILFPLSMTNEKHPEPPPEPDTP